MSDPEHLRARILGKRRYAELVTVVDGRLTDAPLHEAILGDKQPDAFEIRDLRRIARRAGPTDAEAARFFPWPEEE